MRDTPCRVEADLRKREEENDAAELAWEMAATERRNLAEEIIMDGAELRKRLDDEDLAHPLAALMQAYELGGDCKEQVRKLRERLIEVLTDE